MSPGRALLVVALPRKSEKGCWRLMTDGWVPCLRVCTPNDMVVVVVVVVFSE